jgi:hypothetical protein
MLSVTDVTSDIFLNSSAVELQPVVSAEWNQNLFNPPYITTAGDGIKETISPNGSNITNVGTDSTLPGFTVKSFPLTNGSGSVSYSVTTSGGAAYKIVTFVKTNNAFPIIFTAYAKGTSTQYGSTSQEANSYGWTKLETYIGGQSSSDTMTSFAYTISVNSLDSDTDTTTAYFSIPEVYRTTHFDYQYSSYWPTDTAFTYFRPGESYVGSGNAQCSFPSNYRKVSSPILDGYTGKTYSPISSIIQTPSFTMAAAPVPIYKNALPNDMATYKYFVSSASTKSIAAMYAQNINSNKIVIKFNTLMTVPTINLYIDESIITVDGSTSITPPNNADGVDTGTIVLYWTGTAWTKTKWSTMPQFDSTGTLTKYTSFKKISITQIGQTTKSDFSSYTNSNFLADLGRMQLIELSPRLEIDLSNFVKDVSINKSLDSKNNFVPISSVNADDATITLSAIPIALNNGFVPIFSSQSNLSTNVLSNMLRKNIKFYINFNLKSYFNLNTNSFTTLNSGNGRYIPGGVFYSDSWDETDIKDVKIVAYDITRYLQTTAVSDYVAHLKPVFDVITNIFDLSGFTDYDVDSLYKVCTDKTTPLDLAYFYANSRDTTIVDTLAQIFLAYQIGAYINEYGVMTFKSLSQILNAGNSVMTISDSSILEGGYSVNNKAKPGKLSLRYEMPKIKQSAALQNATDPSIKNSPSFVYTTSNDVPWSQETTDSLGFNYLYDDMLEKDNFYTINKNDFLDLFHTFNLNNNGYAMIEDELVSFIYKEYTISNTSGSTTVSVKNDIELSAEVNRFIKKYATGLVVSDGSTKGDYNVVVTPTGRITNVKRGLFGTVPKDHIIITSLSDKGLLEAALDITSFNNISMTTGTSNTSLTNNKVDAPNLPDVEKIAISSTSNKKCLIYPSEKDKNYRTHLVKFDIPTNNVGSSGLFFNNNGSSPEGSYFVELVKSEYLNPSTSQSYSPKKYTYKIEISMIGNAVKRLIAWSDVTGIVNNIMSNLQKVFIKNGTTYTTVSDKVFVLKSVNWYSDGTDVTNSAGEDTGQLISVFLNNIEIRSWQVPTLAYNGANLYTGWAPTNKNQITGLRKKVFVQSSSLNTTDKYFGFCSQASSNLREIYASEKPLVERSVNYWYQDREFLNGIVQGLNTFSRYKNYMMQTNPEVVGINTYDVQYTNPAAVTVDSFWLGYKLQYYPGPEQSDQAYAQTQNIDEYALSFSTPINTGFRAKFAVANNSPQMIYLARKPDDKVHVDSRFTLFTHEIVGPSDPQIIERITDRSNATEIAQVDSPWIQSQEAAQKLLSIIEKGFDGFSKDTTVQIFGNPLVQVGDVITINYSLSKLNQQKYAVHSVSHNFSQGLKTTLVLNMIDRGVSY